MKFLTKLLSLLMCLCMLMPVLAACAPEEKSSGEFQEAEPVIEPYIYSEDDKFALTASAIMTMVKDKVLSAAKSKATEFAGDLGNKVVTKATNWIKSKLLYCLEIEPTPEPPQYTSTDVYNKLTVIEDDIRNMKNSLDILKDHTSDNQYYIKYTAFINSLTEIRTYTETPFNSLETLNGMSEGSEADYSALANSIEVSLRGSGSYVVPIEQQTEISKKTLSYGNAILGDETSSSFLNTYGIFNIIRYFAGRETPWVHQRKEIEDAYMSSIIYTYRNAHALVVFDLAYQMNAIGVEEVYLAPDGTVIAFKYSADGTDAKWYYNAYPYQETALTTKYAATFESFSENPVSITDIDATVYSQLVFLFGYYGQHQAQYNKILRAMDSFTRENNETHFILETQNNRKYAKDLSGMYSQDFITLNKSDEFEFDCDKFKDCTKKEFLEFVNLIKPYAGEQSLYDYLRYVGFEVPKVTDTYHYQNVLILGIEKLSDRDRKDNTQYVRRFKIHAIDIDTKVKDIGDNSFTGWIMCTRIDWSGVCNDKKSWSHKVTLLNYNDTGSLAAIAGEYNCSLSNWSSKGASLKIPYFVSLHGLSTSSRSGRVSRSNMGSTW